MATVEFGIQKDLFEYCGMFNLEDIRYSLPYSDLSLWIPEDSIISRAHQRLPIGRLSNIKQLSFLSYIGPSPQTQYFQDTNHTRYNHEFGVRTVNAEFYRRNGLPEEIPMSEMTAILHDIATPALGDATKLVDPENLHEETHWRNVVNAEGMKFIRENGIDPKDLDKAILNQDLHGDSLDVADKVVYTMDDAYSVAGSHSSIVDLNSPVAKIKSIISRNPNIGNIYQEVGIDPQQQSVFFSNKENLYLLLLLRAHLHQAMYLSPTNQGRDLFIAQLIKPYYSAVKDSPFTPMRLRSMGDTDLIDELCALYTPNDVSDRLSYHNKITQWVPNFKHFKTRQEAEAEEKKLIDAGKPVVGIRECKGFNTGVNFKVVEENHIVPFRDACLGETAQLEGIAQSTQGVNVYYVDEEKYPWIAEMTNKARAALQT